MRHNKFEETLALVGANLPVLLMGDRGTGKTTLASQIAEALGVKFYTISMTRQTTLGHLLGYRSVTTGDYVKTSFYEAVTEGGVMLLDELNAGDPNVLLAINTLDNGYIAFPEGIEKCHKDFRLMATANPTSSKYSGRSVLDAATLDRFDIIGIETDEDLEKSFADPDIYDLVSRARNTLETYGSDLEITTRDLIRFQKRKVLGLTDGFLLKLVGGDTEVLSKVLKTAGDAPGAFSGFNQESAENLSDLLDLLKRNARGNTDEENSSNT